MECNLVRRKVEEESEGVKQERRVLRSLVEGRGRGRGS